MPDRDETGPAGDGPKTGREQGNCSNEPKKKVKKSNRHGNDNWRELKK